MARITRTGEEWDVPEPAPVFVPEPAKEEPAKQLPAEEPVEVPTEPSEPEKVS